LPWECQPTVICSGNSVWECSPTVVFEPPGGRPCPGNSCLGNSAISVKPSAVANLDELQAALKAAMGQVERLQRDEDAAKSVEELKESEGRLTGQLERIRKQLRDRGE